MWLIMSSIMRDKDDIVNHRRDPVPDELIEALHAVVHAVRTTMHGVLREAGSDLTPLEGRVLGFFARHPGATQRELAEHAGRDKGQVARLVAGLRDRGLLEIETDPSDRRVARVQLTAQARRLHDAVMRQRQRLAEVALAGVSSQQRRELRDVLVRMRGNIDSST